APNPPRGPNGGALAEAQAFLREALADGPRAASDVEALARERGLAIGTVRRAKKPLGVVTRKAGPADGGRWRWELPPLTAALAEGTQDDQGAQAAQAAQRTPLAPLT